MAQVTGKSGDNYIVTHDDLSAPASLGMLQPYPDLYSQALGFDPLAPTTQVPVPSSGGFNPDNLIASPLALGKDLVTGGPDAVAARLIGNAPPATTTVPGVDVATTPPPDPGTQGMAPTPAAPPVPPPGLTPPSGGPAGAALPPTVARGTGGGAPSAPAGPDGIDQATGQKLAGEAQGEANERAVYDQDAARRQAMAQAEAQRQADFKRNADAAFKQQQDASAAALAAHNLDPNKFWKDKGVLGTIMFKLSAMAQGFGGGWNGHPEAGAQFVENAIKQNLELQQKRAEAMDKDAEAKGNLVQHFRQAGLDDASAFAASMAAQKEQVAEDLKRAAIKLNDKGLSPAFLKTAGDLTIASQKDHVQLAQDRAKTQEAQASAASSYATAGKTRMETAKLGRTTNADNIARQMAAAGQPIPKALALLTSPEIQKNITGDGQLLTSDASEANKVTANSAPHLATLKNAMRIVNDPNATALSKKQAAQDAYASAKVYMGLKRGGGEDEQAMASLAPGLREALGADINWASPGASARATEALQNEITNVQRRSSAEGQAYGRAPTPGANIDFSKGLR